VGARQAILLGLLGAGCVPIPHLEHDSPELEGQLLRDGSPAADVRVLLVTEGDCRGKARAETRTDALGRFFLERTGHWEFLAPRRTGGDYAQAGRRSVRTSSWVDGGRRRQRTVTDAW